MRRPSGETTMFPMAPRVDSSRSGAPHSAESPLRVAVRRLWRSAEAHTARSRSGDRLAEVGGLTSGSGGPAQLGHWCAAGAVGVAAAAAPEDVPTPQRQRRRTMATGNSLARAGRSIMVRLLTRFECG